MQPGADEFKRRVRPLRAGPCLSSAEAPRGMDRQSVHHTRLHAAMTGGKSYLCPACKAQAGQLVKGLSPRLHEERTRSSIAQQQEIRKQTHCRMQLLNYCTLQERKSVPKSTQVQETNDMACALSRQDTPDTSVNNCQSMIETKAKGKLRARAYR